jgi:hypothetical protein
MCLSAWPIVRRHLRGLDRDLKKFSVEFLVHSMIEEYKISAIKER